MKQNQTEDIRVIREMMERSSKFLSFSGLTGIIAGLTAIAGAGYAYFFILKDTIGAYAGVRPGDIANAFQRNITDISQTNITELFNRGDLSELFVTALIVLAVALFAVFWFSWRKAKKNGQKLFNKVTWRTLYNLAIPLVAGGIFCLAYFWRGDLVTVIAGTLLFYGLALVNISKYTYGEIHYLGLIEIILGLLSLYFGGYALLFWTLGFGVCHIVYGILIYMKYDRHNER